MACDFGGSNHLSIDLVLVPQNIAGSNTGMTYQYAPQY